MALGDVRPLTLGRAAPAGRRWPTTQKSGLIVSVDGPGGSGKSTVGAGAAEEVGYRFCDTGVLYRGLTWLALQRGVDPDDACGARAAWWRSSSWRPMRTSATSI